MGFCFRFLLWIPVLSFIKPPAHKYLVFHTDDYFEVIFYFVWSNFNASFPIYYKQKKIQLPSCRKDLIMLFYEHSLATIQQIMETQPTLTSYIRGTLSGLKLVIWSGSLIELTLLGWKWSTYCLQGIARGCSGDESMSLRLKRNPLELQC